MWTEGRLQLGGPGFIAEGGDGFGADAVDGLQQKLAEIAAGHGVAWVHALLREHAKDLGQCAIDSGGGGEVGAEAVEFAGGGGFRVAP